MTQDERSRIKKYFKKFPTWAVVVVAILGLPSLLVGLSVINFTAHQLMAYQCALDLTTGNCLSEGTDEYFYRDVVSASTQSKSKTYEEAEIGKELSHGLLKDLMTAGKLQFNAAQMFILTTSGGTSIEVVLRDPKLIERAGGGSIPTDMA